MAIPPVLELYSLVDELGSQQDHHTVQVCGTGTAQQDLSVCGGGGHMRYMVCACMC